MSGLADLLPDDCPNRDRLIQKLDETRVKSYSDLAENIQRRAREQRRKQHKSYKELIAEMDAKRNKVHKVTTPKNSNKVFSSNKLASEARKKRENEKRELARNGIMVYDRVFVKMDNSFWRARRKSLESNAGTRKQTSKQLRRLIRNRKKKSL